MLQRIANPSSLLPRGPIVAAGLGLLCLALAACEAPPPRSFNDFMEDRIAMEGTLTRCNAHPADAQTDIECANARRASTAIQLREERERHEQLLKESEQKIVALKAEMAQRDRVAREAALAAAKAAQEAYDKMWGSQIDSDPTGAGVETQDAADADPTAAPALPADPSSASLGPRAN